MSERSERTSVTGHRRRWRRGLALPFAVVLVAVGLKLLTMSWFSTRGASAYGDADFDTSAVHFDRLTVLNVVDPWRAHLGLGATRFREGDLAGAEASFRRALELAPGRCDVRFDLVVTIEAQGDELTGGETRDVEETERQDGIARYRVALDVASAAACPSSVAGDAGERLEAARQRLRDKLGAEGGDQGEPLEQPDDPAEEPDEGAELDPRQQRIDERNRTGAGARDDASDLDPTQVQEAGQSNW